MVRGLRRQGVRKISSRRRRRGNGSVSRSGVEKFVSTAISIPAVRKFIATTGDSGPEWFNTVLKYARLALSAIGYLGLTHQTSSNVTYHEIGGIVCMDLGPEDLLADTGFVGPFMSTQTTEWKLKGSGWISFNRAKISWIDITVRPTAQMARRGGTVIISIHDLDITESQLDTFVKRDVDATSTKHVNRARVDSFAALSSLGTSITADFDRPITMRYKPKQGWTEIGVPGAYLAECHMLDPKNLDDPEITRYGASTTEARYGGRPLCRLYIAYQDTNTITNSGSDLEVQEYSGFEVELRSQISLSSPTGMPYFVTTGTKEEVMEMSSINVVRKKPITLIEGGSFVVTQQNRFKPASRDELKLINQARERSIQFVDVAEAMEQSIGT